MPAIDDDRVKWKILVVDDDQDKFDDIVSTLQQLRIDLVKPRHAWFMKQAIYEMSSDVKFDIIFIDMQLLGSQIASGYWEDEALSERGQDLWNFYDSGALKPSGYPKEPDFQGFWCAAIATSLQPKATRVVYTARPEVLREAAIAPFYRYPKGFKTFYRVLKFLPGTRRSGLCVHIDDLLPVLEETTARLLESDERLKWEVFHKILPVLASGQPTWEQWTELCHRRLQFRDERTGMPVEEETSRLLPVLSPAMIDETSDGHRSEIRNALNRLYPSLSQSIVKYELDSFVHDPEAYNDENSKRINLHNAASRVPQLQEIIPIDWLVSDPVNFATLRRAWSYAYCSTRNIVLGIREVWRELNPRYNWFSINLDVPRDVLYWNESEKDWVDNLEIVQPGDLTKFKHGQDNKESLRTSLHGKRCRYVLGCAALARMLKTLLDNCSKLCKKVRLTPNATLLVQGSLHEVTLTYSDNSPGFATKEEIESVLRDKRDWKDGIASIVGFAMMHKCNLVALYPRSGEPYCISGNAPAKETSGFCLIMGFESRRNV